MQLLPKVCEKLSLIKKPLFKLMEKSTNFEWSEEYQRAFEELKECANLNISVSIPSKKMALSTLPRMRAIMEL